ncbi:MAG TPA: STAS domain-containing protein [Phycisphaerae bacterium]|nr:STAS domain-containing protein [Phycisphaerae bacterium]HRW54255.1 STAS domain-containing protein [Phycisphaerae bacterium]
MADTRLLVTDYAGVTVVTFQDNSILDARQIDQIGRELYELADKKDKRKFILDFSNVRFLGSQTLGVLINLHKKAAAGKGEVVLCCLRKDLLKVFKITSLDKVFKFFNDDASALKHFGVHVS